MSKEPENKVEIEEVSQPEPTAFATKGLLPEEIEMAKTHGLIEEEKVDDKSKSKERTKDDGSESSEKGSEDEHTERTESETEEDTGSEEDKETEDKDNCLRQSRFIPTLLMESPYHLLFPKTRATGTK